MFKLPLSAAAAMVISISREFQPLVDPWDFDSRISTFPGRHQLWHSPQTKKARSTKKKAARKAQRKARAKSRKH